MIIRIENHHSFTFEILPDEDGWKHRTPNRHAWQRCNEAGLAWLLAHYRRLADQTEQEARRERERCIYDLPFRCPVNFVCQQRNQRREQAAILLSYYEPDHVPVGQMSLFEPHRTHKRVWRHCRTGKIYEGEKRPIQTVVAPVCRKMAVAILEWHRRQWTDIPYWRIKPLTDDTAGREWLLALQNQHAGRIPTCVFDDWGEF